MTLPAAAARLLSRLPPSTIRLGLDAPRGLLEALGSPQERFSSVLVAGTNGKGSTAAWLAAMAVAAGYRTGLYTSPHLEDLEERVRVDGRTVDGGELGRQLLRAAAAAENALGGLPTYFELVTAAAMLCFAAAEVELAVLEVGMGGRLDATNVAEPVLSLITEIGFDHERHLGGSLEEIAVEKAGILRRGGPAIAGCSRREALETVRREARRCGASLQVAAETARWRRPAAAGASLLVETASARHRLSPALAGAHQADNLALAVLAAEELRRRGWTRLDAAAIAAGAERCRWPGRLEAVELESGRSVLLDVAHNPDAAANLAAHLQRLGRRYDLLFGTLADKRWDRVLPPLAAAAATIVLTRPPDERGLDPERLRPLVAGREVLVEPRCEAALTRALEGGEDLLVVCGSFYLVGAVRRLLRRRYGMPPRAAEQAAC